MHLIDCINLALDKITEASRQGAACCYIRNTVGDARSAWEELKARKVDALLFHSRFAQGDRQQIERKVIQIFGGKRDLAKTPHSPVLVATQVVEQSLDLDFDFLVSDLAPIDLLIQRMGRFRRHPERDHKRPVGLSAEMFVVSPEPIEDAPSDWLHKISYGTGLVYCDHGVLWRTARILRDLGAVDTRASAIARNDGVRALIADVYGKVDDVPKELRLSAIKAEGRAGAHRSIARSNLLAFKHGYNAERFTVTQDHATPTRLGELTTVVRLARGVDGNILPWIKDQGEGANAWSLSEVRLAEKQMPREAQSGPHWAEALTALRLSWAHHERNIPVVILEHDAGADEWCGKLYADHLQEPWLLRYSITSGASIVSNV